MLRVASIGMGWVSTHRHIPSLLRHPRVRLIGVIDRNDRKATSAASKFACLSGNDLDAPWMKDVDAVTIGTPPDTHCELAVAALQRGLHVLTEKPFAMSPAEAHLMIDAAEKADRNLSVVHNFQFARSVIEARARFASGAAGELRSVLGLQFSNHQRRLPVWYKTLPCGLFYDEAPHLLYLAKSFLDDFTVTNVHIARSLDPLDNTPRAVSIKHDAGRVSGALEMFFNAALSEWQLVLMGSRETLIADIFRDILIKLPNDRQHESLDVIRTSASTVLGHLAGTVTSGVKHMSGTLDYGNDEVIRRWVEAVETRRDAQGISMRDGLAVVEAMGRVLEWA